MNTAVITGSAALLHASGEHINNLFNAVLAHTAQPDPDDPDDYVIPSLAQVHIEVRAGELRLACTDRYTMGVVRQPMTVTSHGFTASFAVAADDVALALPRTDETDVTLVVEEDGLRIAGSEGPAEVPGVPSEPPWRATLEKILDPRPTPTGIIAINPGLLARFQDAKPLAPDAAMLFQLGGEESVVIATLDTCFLGIVAPVSRVAATRSGLIPDAPLDDWFDLIDEGGEPRG